MEPWILSRRKGDITSIQGLPHIDSRNQESHELPFSHSGTPFSRSASFLLRKICIKPEWRGYLRPPGKAKANTSAWREHDVSSPSVGRRLSTLAQEPRHHLDSSTTRTSPSTRCRNLLLHGTIFLSDCAVDQFSASSNTRKNE
jgi:hypothetical protein